VRHLTPCSPMESQATTDANLQALNQLPDGPNNGEFRQQNVEGGNDIQPQLVYESQQTNEESTQPFENQQGTEEQQMNGENQNESEIPFMNQQAIPGMPGVFPPQGYPFPQDMPFPPQMMWNNQFPPMNGSGGPNGAPFPGFGMPPFPPLYPNFPYRMKDQYYNEQNVLPEGYKSNRTGGKLLSQPSLVKCKHNESEQRRRDRINHHFEELKLLLPSHKGNKSGILEAAIEYIQKYQVQVQQLERLNFDIARENNDIIQILAQQQVHSFQGQGPNEQNQTVT